MESEELQLLVFNMERLAFTRLRCLVPRPDCAPSPIFIQIPNKQFH